MCSCNYINLFTVRQVLFLRFFSISCCLFACIFLVFFYLNGEIKMYK